MSAAWMNLASTIAPIVGAYLVERYSWRWTAWVTLMLCGAVGVLCVFLLRETPHNRILMRRAARLRRETGNEKLHSRNELLSLDWRVLLRKYCTKPVRMFVQEPILIVFTTYLTLVYGSLYLSYQLFPRALGLEDHSINLAFHFRRLGCHHGFDRVLDVYLDLVQAALDRVRNSGKGSHHPRAQVTPHDPGCCAASSSAALVRMEWGLPLDVSSHCVLRDWFFIADHLHRWHCIHRRCVLGQHGLGDLNSCPAAKSGLRFVSTVRGPMYDALGIEWSATRLAALSAMLTVAPVLFWIYGARIRSWSRFSIGDI